MRFGAIPISDPSQLGHRAPEPGRIVDDGCPNLGRVAAASKETHDRSHFGPIHLEVFSRVTHVR
jgi:hypothetical protein